MHPKRPMWLHQLRRRYLYRNFNAAVLKAAGDKGLSNKFSAVSQLILVVAVVTEGGLSVEMP